MVNKDCLLVSGIMSLMVLGSLGICTIPFLEVMSQATYLRVSIGTMVVWLMSWVAAYQWARRYL